MRESITHEEILTKFTTPTKQQEIYNVQFDFRHRFTARSYVRHHNLQLVQITGAKMKQRIVSHVYYVVTKSNGIIIRIDDTEDNARNFVIRRYGYHVVMVIS